MTVTINAVTSTGLVQTSDGSGIIKLQSAGVTTNALAWVNFNGTGTVAIRASGNVSSITDNGVGDYTINFTNSMTDANYAVVGIPSNSGANTGVSFCSSTSTTQAAGLVRITTVQANVGALDCSYVQASIFR